MSNIGVVAATNLGVVAFALLGYSQLFMLGAAISFLALLTSLAIPRRKVSAVRGTSLPLSMIRKASRTLRWFYLVTALDSFAWAIATPFFTITPTVVFSAMKEQIALMNTLIWGTAIATNIMVASISDRIGSRRGMMAFSEGLGVACFALYVSARSIYPLYLCAVLFGLVTVTWGPITAAYITEAAGREEIHEAVGTWMTVTAVARIPGPFIGGFLAEAWDPRAPYLVALPLVAALALLIERTLPESRMAGKALF